MKHIAKEHTAEEITAICSKIAKAMKQGKDKTLGDTLTDEELETVSDLIYDFSTICQTFKK